MVEASSPREMALPETALITLRRSLRGEAGPLATVRALHAAGYETGEALAGSFLSFLGDDLEDMPRDRFWRRFRDFWRRRGWGRLEHRDLHPALGLLVSGDWVEAGDETRESQPSCAFTSGVLASLLGRVAGGPIAVLEIQCRARGDDRCAFAFGSETVVHDVYGALLDGADLQDALSSL